LGKLQQGLGGHRGRFHFDWKYKHLRLLLEDRNVRKVPVSRLRMRDGGKEGQVSVPSSASRLLTAG
jgi:hypothetical protein